MTKKQWLSMCEKDKVDYVFTLGVKSCWGRMQADAAHREFGKIISIIHEIEGVEHDH